MAKLGSVGVFGGTFDPPHRGHVAIATRASVQLDLDLVWWIPVGSPPHKPDTGISTVYHRFEMVRLTLESVGNPTFELLTIDRDRPGPHYMVDTVQILQREYDPARIFLILGEDSLYDLPNWAYPDQLIRATTLAVYPRGNDYPSIEHLDRVLPGVNNRVTFLSGDLFHASSTQIRAIAQQNGDFQEYVVPEVAEYISSHHLYLKPYAN